MRDTRIVKDANKPVALLKTHIRKHPQLGELLCTSINVANELAAKDLDEKIYSALAWPTTLDAYYAYLSDYAKLIPSQTGEDAFLVHGKTVEYQEIYIRLCHFYWLVNQPISDIEGKTVIAQDDKYFRRWLVLYVDYLGSFLDTPESMNEDTLNSFIKYSPQYRVQDSMLTNPLGLIVPNNPSGWLTFNQFFARTLNGGLRPIDYPESNYFVTSPADCTFMETYSIGDNNIVFCDRGGPTAKQAHYIGDITDLLNGSPYAKDFAGGTFVHYFLNTFSYHRFHAPVDGILLEARTIPGLVYLDVGIKNDGSGQFYALDSANGGYEFRQARGLTIWDTRRTSAGNVGLVGCLPIGMAQVSSSVITGTVGNHSRKGEEFGYFQFGGSDIVLLFQKGQVKSLLETSLTKYLHYGNAVASCYNPNESQTRCRSNIS